MPPIGINPGSMIPLQEAFQPASVADATQKGISMAGQQVDLAEGKLQLENDQDAKRDKDQMQQYLRSGGDLFSPEGISKATNDLKGKVSPKTYMGLIDYGQKFQQNQAQTSRLLSQATDDQITALNSRYDLVARSMAPVYEAWQSDWQQRLKARGLDPKTAPANEVTQAQQDAMPAYNAARQARLQELSQMSVGGQAPVDANFLKSFSQMSPDDLHGTLQYTKFYQQLVKDDQERRLRESQVRSNDARAKMYERGDKKLVSAQEVRELLKDPSLAPEERAYWEQYSKNLASRPGVGNASVTPFAQLPKEDQVAVDTAAWNKVINQKDPPARGGLYAQVMSYIGQIANENGMTTQELLTASADVKTRLQAKRTFEQRVLNLKRAEDVMDNELPVMKQNMEAVDMSKYPRVTRFEFAALRELGDPNVIKIDQSAEAILNEFEGIMTGNVGGALNVQDVQKAREDYKKIQSPQAMQAWMENAHAMVERAKQANEKTRKEWMEGINKTIGGKSPLTRLQGGGSATGAASAPAPAWVAPGGATPDAIRIRQDELRDLQAKLKTNPQDFAEINQSIEAVKRDLQRMGVNPDQTAAPPGAAGKVVPRKPGETPSQYLQRIKTSQADEDPLGLLGGAA